MISGRWLVRQRHRRVAMPSTTVFVDLASPWNKVDNNSWNLYLLIFSRPVHNVPWFRPLRKRIELAYAYTALLRGLKKKPGCMRVYILISFHLVPAFQGLVYVLRTSHTHLRQLSPTYAKPLWLLLHRSWRQHAFKSYAQFRQIILLYWTALIWF